MNLSSNENLNPAGLILAAGRGSRMKNITSTKPKCFIEVKGKRLLDWQVDAMKCAGINDIAVITGYKADSFSGEQIERIYNPNWESTDMVFSLACASDWLSKRTCIVSYSDIFFEPHAVGSLLKSDEDISIAYDPLWLEMWKERFDNPIDDAETFKVDNNQFLTEIGGEISDVEEVQGQYMGILKFEPPGWKMFSVLWEKAQENGLSGIQMTQLLGELVSENPTFVRAIPFSGVWGELDIESDIEFYNR